MIAFDWMFSPTAWVGFLTLVLLEIVLGIDNLLFVAILADRLPASMRGRARRMGLSVALLLRLVFLAVVGQLMRLTRPLFTLGPLALSGRDLILLSGGAFLLCKATLELHERLEGEAAGPLGQRGAARFWWVVVQIIALDLVFSIDSIVTAVGMSDQITMMMMAVVVAMGVMLFASKPLAALISAHPTLVVLCLSFLLMIGFSLLSEGLGLHIPKGYLYAAIGFAVLIEVFNQTMRRNQRRHLLAGARHLRERTAQLVLRMLGGAEEAGAVAEKPGNEVVMGGIFGREELTMVRGVLDLAERPVRSIMTPRTEIQWIDPREDVAVLRQELRTTAHHWLPLAHDDMDQLLGVATVRDMICYLNEHGGLDVATIVQKPLTVPESMSVLRLIEAFRHGRVPLALVVDEYGSVEGLVTPTDVLEVIAGELSSSDADEVSQMQQEARDSWLLDATLDLRRVEQLNGCRLSGEDDFGSLAGYVLSRLGRLPSAGERLIEGDWQLEIVAMDGVRIDRVRLSRRS